MKCIKYLITLCVGVILGAIITFSPSIYGAGSSLLGSKIDKTLDVKMNGNSIGQAGVIEGTSYIPIRAVANALSVEVKVDSKEINLTTSILNENVENAKQQAELEKNKKRDSYTKSLEKLKSNIEVYEARITKAKGNLDIINRKNVTEDQKENQQFEINKWQKVIDDTTREIDETKNKIIEMETLLNDL